MKLKLILFFSILLAFLRRNILRLYFVPMLFLCSCKAQNHVATTSHERIEERVKPVAIGADTIEIEFSTTDNRQQSLREKSLKSVNQRSLSLWREKSVGDNHSEGVKICVNPSRVFDEVKERIEKKEKYKSELSVLSVGDKTSRSDKNSVNSVHSVRDNNSSVRVRSTRALNIESRHTDTTQTLRITLRPDTVYVPYTTHIRSDTIVAPDPTTAAKLTSARWKMAMLLLIIIIIIVYRLRSTDNRQQ